MILQQGDVLIKQVKVIPETAVKVVANKVPGINVLAEGETSGHYHGVDGRSSVLFQDGLDMYLQVLTETPVEHQEHKAFVIPPGTYKIDIVQEYDHFKEMADKVRD